MPSWSRNVRSKVDVSVVTVWNRVLTCAVWMNVRDLGFVTDLG